MSQADGKRKLQRISLNLKTDKKSSWYNFMINPESYEEIHPQRTNIFQTRESVVVEDFGPGLGTINFSGTTGFRTINEYNSKGKKLATRNGAQRLFALEKLIEEYSLAGYNTEPGGNPNNAELIFYNRTDGKSWYVHLAEEGFTITRSVEESLLYRYSINLVILRKASSPSKSQIDNAQIGNPIRLSSYKTSTHYINQSINPRSSSNSYGNASNNMSGTVGTKDKAGAKDPQGGITMLPN